MAYSSGMLNKRIHIARRSDEQHTEFGEDGQSKYEWLGWFWAAENWNKGVKSLQQGAIEAYDTVMFRLRWCPCIDRWCLIWYNGTWYNIVNLNGDEQGNQIQILAQEIPNPESITIVEPSQS